MFLRIRANEFHDLDESLFGCSEWAIRYQLLAVHCTHLGGLVRDSSYTWQNEQISWWFMLHTKMWWYWTCMYHHATSNPVWNHPVTGVSVLATLAMLITIIGVRRKALVIDLLRGSFQPIAKLQNPWRNQLVEPPPLWLEIKVIQLKVLQSTSTSNTFTTPLWLLNLGVFPTQQKKNVCLGNAIATPCLHAWNPHVAVPHSLWISR